MNKRLFSILLLFSFSLSLIPHTVVAVRTRPVRQVNSVLQEAAKKKPTIKESWGKLVRLKFSQLNKADAWNIFISSAGVTSVGLGCFLFYKKIYPRIAYDRLRRQILNSPVMGTEHECSVCLEDYRIQPEHVLLCGHFNTCGDCLQQQVTIAINERNFDALICPECHQQLSREDIVCITNNDHTILNRYDRYNFERNANARHCPTPNCTYVFRYNGKNELMNCLLCNQQFCSNCLINHTNDVMCEEADNLPNNMRHCPNCHLRIEKIDGCNYIACPGCDYRFCWRCGNRALGHVACERCHDIFW
jgi:IBR domain/IBR domain, a half RING-finger domain